MPLVLNSWGSGWLGVLSIIKRILKGSLLLIRYFLTSGTKHQWKQSRKSSCCPGLLVYSQGTGSWCLSFPFKAWGLTALKIRAVLIINLTAFAQNSRVGLSLSVLTRGAHFSSLLINVLCGIFFQNRALLSALKSCSGRYLFSSVILLMVSGNSSAPSWLAKVASPLILTVFKLNLFLKLSNHPLLALNSPALDPSPSFYFVI